jgi:hypothetical protein
MKSECAPLLAADAVGQRSLERHRKRLMHSKLTTRRKGSESRVRRAGLGTDIAAFFAP